MRLGLPEPEFEVMMRSIAQSYTAPPKEDFEAFLRLVPASFRREKLQ
jgi:hypothetical protein